MNTTIIMSRRTQDKLNTNYLGKDHYPTRIQMSESLVVILVTTNCFKIDKQVYVCVCVCVHVRERVGDREIEIGISIHLFNKLEAPTAY